MNATATGPAIGPATTLYQRNLMAHALGLAASHGHCPARNSICLATGSLDANEANRLIRMGLMFRGVSVNDGRDFYAHVTAAGAAELGVELRRED